MNKEVSPSVSIGPQSNMNNQTVEQSSSALRDYYNPEIKTLADVEKRSTLDQLKYLSDVREAADADVWYSVFEADKILANVASSGQFSPLIRAVANSFKPDVNDYGDEDRNIIREEYGYSSIVTPDMAPDGILSEKTKVMNEEEIKAELKKCQRMKNNLPSIIESDSPEEDALMDLLSLQNELEFALNMIYFRRNQARLHNEFPSAPKNKQLVKIAPDAAGTLDFQKKYDEGDSRFSFGSSMDSILDRDGHNTPGEDTALDDESIIYLKVVHGNTRLKASISEMINIDLSKIPLEAQAYLLKFMAKSDNGRFDRLCKTLHGISDEKARLKLAEGFLAAGFGEDFGDAR